MKKWLCLMIFGFMISAAFALTGAEMNWSRIGPVAGTIVQIVPDRAHPGVWYMVEEHHRTLYRSVNNGEQWIYTGVKNVRMLLVHSASSEVFVVRETQGGRELLQSVDLGRSFQVRSRKSPYKIFDHPTNPRILWGSSLSTNYGNGYDLTVSYDRGATWNEFSNLPYKLDKKYDIYGEKIEPDSYYLSSILVSPFDPNTVYISTEVEFPISCSGEYIDLELVSTNGGRSWASAEWPNVDYLYDPAFPERAFSIRYNEVRILTQGGWKQVTDRTFRSLISVPGRPNQLYGLYYGKQWVSRDGGAHWSRVSLGPAGLATTLQARSDPTGSLLAGTYGGGIYVIDDDRTWRQVTAGLKEADVRAVVSAPGSNLIYAVTGSSGRFLYRSVDGGQTWKNISENLKSSRSGYGLDLVVDPRNARHVFALHDGISVSFDAGATWRTVPGSSLFSVTLNSDSSIAYFTKDFNNHIFKSSDGGITVHQMTAEFGAPGNHIHSVAEDPFNGYIYAATYHGLFVSRDGGRTAEQIATDLFPECLTCASFTQIVALPQRGQYLTLVEGWLYKSVNQGVTWQKLSPARGRIYVADDHGLHLYLIYERLFESVDGGRTWDGITAAIHPALGRQYDSIYSMTDPQHLPLYLATSVGAFVGN